MRISNDGSAKTVRAFTWNWPHRAIIEGTLLAFFQVSFCYYQYDLNTVHMALDCHTVGSARMIQVPKKVAMPSGAENMVLVVN